MLTILDKATCRIDCGGEIGTGFFVNGNTIITAKHVIDNFISASENAKDIIIDNLSNHSEKVTCTYIDHCDDAGVAMISIEGDYRNDHYLTLCASEIIEEESIKSYGYPNSEDGRLVGEPLIGKVLRTISDSDETMHDVSINVDNFAQGTYGGFSGSPVMNQDKYITSFIIDENIRYISAVSIKKVANFLRNQSIEVKEDYLTSFEEYKDSTFNGFGQIKPVCLSQSKQVLSNTSPNEIIKNCEGNIFYPAKSDSLSNLIGAIKLNKDLKDALWPGWFEFLTYVVMLEGKYDDLNNIKIEVKLDEKISKFRIRFKPKKIISKVQLSFLFSENESYFDVASEYIHQAMQDKSLVKDTCNIFNSHNQHFAVKKLTSNSIVLNIGDPDHSGPSIPEVRVAVLNLNDLREDIINSEDITSAQLNLRKRFEDALK